MHLLVRQRDRPLERAIWSKRKNPEPLAARVDDAVDRIDHRSRVGGIAERIRPEQEPVGWIA